MRALTFWQPWLWAMKHAGKGLENRGWLPPPDVRKGAWFALHAGAHYDRPGAAAIARICGRWPPSEVSQRCIVGAARISGPIAVAWPAEPRWWQEEPRGRHGSPTTPARLGAQQKWAFGPLAWPLECRWLDQVLPVPRGWQRFWNLPKSTALNVWRKLELAA